MAFVTAFAVALHQYYRAVFEGTHPDLESADRELPEITYYPPKQIEYRRKTESDLLLVTSTNSRAPPTSTSIKAKMDNHDGQNNTGSNEKLLPSAPASTSPFPPDVSFGANNEKTNLAAAAAAAAAARHTELLQAQQAAAMRAAAHGGGPPGGPPGHEPPGMNNGGNGEQTDYDNIQLPHARTEDISKFGTLLLSAISILLVLVTLPFSLCYCVKVVQEYERAVIFRLGRLKKGGASGPGLFFILPCIDNYKKVDLRTVTFDVPPQEILSRDSVTVTVDAVICYRVSNPTMVR